MNNIGNRMRTIKSLCNSVNGECLDVKVAVGSDEILGTLTTRWLNQCQFKKSAISSPQKQISLITQGRGYNCKGAAAGFGGQCEINDVFITAHRQRQIGKSIIRLITQLNIVL